MKTDIQTRTSTHTHTHTHTYIVLLMERSFDTIEILNLKTGFIGYARLKECNIRRLNKDNIK